MNFRLLLAFALGSLCLPSASGADSVIPNERQREWADCEIGVIIHQDVQCYEHGFEFRQKRGYVPPASVFNPESLDTDQWLAVAKAAGAKYAVLVAKHCSGFSLWPTKAHGYSVAASPWKGGKGDVVADFIASCRKYGIRPGIYASLGCNAYLGVDNNRMVGTNTTWASYLAVVKTQLTELWSNYGELFEVWFDGGNLPADKGGREVEDLLAKLQPNAIVFQGDPKRFASVRWGGNENAYAAETCWSRSNGAKSSDGVAVGELAQYAGDFNGACWNPVEADTPNRDRNFAFQAGWMWQPGEDAYVYPAENLLERYFTSVGRNANLLIGLPIDNRGLVPDKDAAELKRFGRLVGELYANRVAQAKGKGAVFTLEAPKGSRPNLLSLQEDLAFGENVHSCFLAGFDGAAWHTLADITNVGHRRLVRFAPGDYVRYRLCSWDFRQTPVFRDISLYEVK